MSHKHTNEWNNMVDRLSQMLDMQRALQVVAYGRDPGALSIDEKVQFIKDMTLAMTDELHELLAEVSWKPWTHGDNYINYDNAKKELIDLWHMFQNMMLVLDMSSDELYKMYVKKRQVNIDRQLNGYDGVSTKCPKCRRALEDVVLHQIHIETGIIVQCACGQDIPIDVARSFLTD